MKIILNALILSVYVGSALSAPHLEEYAVDPEVRAILDAHSKEIFKKINKIHSTIQWHGVWKFNWLPGYYIKYGLDRIKGVERIRRCIQNHNLDLLTTPDKRVYHIKGRPSAYSDLNYAIVIKAVERSRHPKPLNLEQVKQLCTIIHKADYVDMTSTNYIQMDDGRISLIDTEGIFDASKRIKGFLRMVGTGHNPNTAYTEEALKYIFREIKQELKKNPENISFALEYLKNELAQHPPRTWDYMSYMKKYFKDLEEYS